MLIELDSEFTLKKANILVINLMFKMFAKL